MARNPNNFTFYSLDWQASQPLLSLIPEERAIFFELIIKAHQENNQISEDLDVWCRMWNIKKPRLRKVLDRLCEKNMIEKQEEFWYVPSVQRRVKARIDGSEAYKKKLEKSKSLKGNLKATPSSQDIRYKIKDNKIQSKEADKDNDAEDYSKWYDWFMESWNASYLHYKKKTISMKRLTKSNEDSLKYIVKTFGKEETKQAMVGLMMQKSFPADGDLISLTHFLKDDGVFIDKYLMAYQTDNKEIYKAIKKFE